MSRQERIEKLIRQAEEVLSEIADEAYAEVQTVEREAEENIQRHRDAVAELSDLQDRVQILQAEKEQLPIEHSRAMLDDDYDAELRIKERANTIREELAEAESRIEVLEEEITALAPPHNPGWPSHPNDVQLFHYRRVKKALTGPLGVYQRAAQALHAAATRPLGAFEEKQRELAEITYSLQEERSWDDEQRDALRGAGNMPGRSSVRTIEADPAALERKGATL